MKAFLMYPSRDFDADRLLVRRERESRHRQTSPDRASELQGVLPWNEAALTQDLGLDLLFKAMSRDDNFLFEVAKVALLSSLTDVDTITYRQRILADCLKQSKVVGQIYQIVLDAIDREKRGIWGYFSPRDPAGVLHRAVEVLQVFVEALKRLRAIADQHGSVFASDGFVRFFNMLKEELSDEYFRSIDEHLRRLKFRPGILISARLGEGNKGASYSLRRPHEDERGWLARLLAEKPETYSFQLHPRDEAGARALAELGDRAINLVANALAQSTDHILSFFEMLRTELAFYIGCLNLHAEFERLALTSCLPSVAPLGERKLAFIGLCDASLALSMGRKVVGNDLNADRNDLVMVTGANTGGKSTFLRSVGLAQLMLQAGMFVAAEKFSSEVADGVFTHYKREEDTAMESGKWDEELSRMSELVSRIRSNSVLLFNESFASTNEREGSEIAGRIVSALLERRVRVFFVTHLYHLANFFFVHRPERSSYLRAERRSDGTRPYKLILGEPLQTSYGEDLYRAIFADKEGGRAATSMERKASM